MKTMSWSTSKACLPNEDWEKWLDQVQDISFQKDEWEKCLDEVQSFWCAKGRMKKMRKMTWSN